MTILQEFCGKSIDLGFSPSVRLGEAVLESNWRSAKRNLIL
ncbi:hypothetical protein [Microcoleus anatoxicus]